MAKGKGKKKNEKKKCKTILEKRAAKKEKKGSLGRKSGFKGL